MASSFSYYPFSSLKKVLDQMPLKEQTLFSHLPLHKDQSIHWQISRRQKIIIFSISKLNFIAVILE